MRFRIRKLRMADRAAVGRIARSLPEWFTAEGQTMIAQDVQTQQGFVAVEGDRVVGFLTYFTHEGIGHIGWLGVAPAKHRQGIGRLLSERFESALRRLNIAVAEVATLGDSVDYEPYNHTRAFYRAIGYSTFRVEKRGTPQCPEMLYLRKKI